LTAGGARLRADVFSGASYGSSSDLRVHFGLGNTSKVDSIEIAWPSGAKEKLTVADVDRFYTVREGEGFLPN
jgi:hypothetical protein